MKVYEPNSKIIEDLRFNIKPKSVVLCKAHSASLTPIREISGISTPKCVYCVLESNSGKYPRIAYCPNGTDLQLFPFIDKIQNNIWLEGDDLICVPTFNDIDLYIKHANRQNVSNHADTKVIRTFLYQRVFFDKWVVELDSENPPLIMSYPEVWKDKTSKAVVLRSLADYRPRLASWHPEISYAKYSPALEHE